MKDVNRAVMLDCPIFHALVAGSANSLLDSGATQLRQRRLKALEEIWEQIVLGEVPKDSYRSKDRENLNPNPVTRQLLTGGTEEDYDSPFEEEDPLNGV